jgi:hypothetical protein
MRLPKAVATQAEPALSPSGQYILAVKSESNKGITLQRVQILDRKKMWYLNHKNNLIFATPYTFSEIRMIVYGFILALWE